MKWFYLSLTLLVFISCNSTDKSGSNENLNVAKAHIDDKVIPNMDYSNRDYSFCRDLDTALAHPLDVKVLMLNGSIEFKKLPVEIKSLKNLTSLEIGVGQSLDLEDAFLNIKDLDSLRRLSIVGCKLDLYGKIRSLKKIKELKLIDNGIREFPIDLIDDLNLHQLTIEDGAFNEKKRFEFIGNSKGGNGIKGLYLLGYKGESLNDNIFKITSIEELVVNHSNLNFASEKFKNLVNLKKLDIAFTPLAKNKEQLKKLRDVEDRKFLITTYQAPE